MSLDVWISIIVGIPIAIIANLLSPKVQGWLDSRPKKKSLEKQQHEGLKTWEVENKKGASEEIKEVKDTLINAAILYTPFILLIIGEILNIIENTVFVLLFILSFVLLVNLIIRLTQRFIQLIKYKRANGKEAHKELEKIRNECISVGIIYLPVILLLVGILLDIYENNIFILLFLLSCYPSINLIIRSVLRYIQHLRSYKREIDILGVNKKEASEEIEKVKGTLINAAILYAPFILLIIGGILNIVQNTIFVLLFLLSCAPPINLITRLIQRFIQLLKYKRVNKKEAQEELERKKTKKKNK